MNETAELLRLDQAGFIPGPHAEYENFIAETGITLDTHRKFDEKLESDGRAGIFNCVEVTPEERIDPELLAEAAELTSRLYGFEVKHVPGFYLTRGVGLLWGGCMLSDPDEHFSVMLLRNVFKKQRRFLNYSRNELLAHELCHSARQNLMEPELEEYFAYQTSGSAFRRYFGNCFIRERDALCFVLPMFLLPAAELVRALWCPALWSWCFWVAALLYPAFLCIRNASSRKLVARARKALESCGVSRVEAVLFRMLPDELRRVADFRGQPEEFRIWAAEQAAKELRWQVIVRRFIDEDEFEKISTTDVNEYENS